MAYKPVPGYKTLFVTQSVTSRADVLLLMAMRAVVDGVGTLFCNHFHSILLHHSGLFS